MMRARTMHVFVAVLLFLAQLAPPPIAYAANTTNKTNPLQKAVSLANQVADALQKLAYAMVVIAFFVGVIHWAMGRGPEWLSRAILAAFAIATGMWIISYFIGK